jgi:bifunctional UDP-N-acetylglucosamine pyrophosphorylase/glucosamine-1-phosphate N-acetyltransferase
MRTLLIVAGRSTRFWPLSDKNLWRLAGKTLLQHQVDRLQEAGCTDVVLVGGAHNMDALRALFPDNKIIEQADLSLGMRGALLSSLLYCGAEPVLIVSGNDVVESSAYASLLKKFKKNAKADGLLLARKVDRYFPGGYLTLENGLIRGIVEKPGAGKEPSDLVNLVAHVHRNAATLFDALSRVSPTKDDGYEIALDELCKEGHYEAVAYKGLWQAVKYPWHLLALLPILLNDMGKKKISRKAHVHKSAVVEGHVILEEGVRVLPHASVIGPCHIGKGTVIGNNALVRGSSIGQRCVIGYNTEVVRSVIGDDVWTHSSYVGDSVLSDNVSLGAGTTTGNLRLDEAEISSLVKGESVGTGLDKFGTAVGEGARTGIHTCIGPGVKIGARSFVGSNALISQDIPDDSFVKTSTAIDIRPNTKAPAKPADREKFKRKI